MRGACPKEVVQPKCDELSRVCDMVTERLSRRLEILLKSRDLMERVEKVRVCVCVGGIQVISQLVKKTFEILLLVKIEKFVMKIN